MSEAALKKLKQDEWTLIPRAQLELDRRTGLDRKEWMREHLARFTPIDWELRQEYFGPFKVDKSLFRAMGEGSKISRFIIKGMGGAAVDTVAGTYTLVVHPKDAARAIGALITDAKARQAVLDAIEKQFSSGNAEDIGALFVEVPLAATGGVAVVKVTVKITSLATKGTITLVRSGKRLFTEPLTLAPKNVSRLIGIADKDAASLGNAIKKISVDGTPAIESVEAFGSRAGSTFRGRPPTPESDLDIYVTVKSDVANSPAKLAEVRNSINEIADLFSQTKKIKVNPVIEIDAVAPANKVQLKNTPFIRLDEP